MIYNFSISVPNGEMQGTAIGHCSISGKVRANDPQHAASFVLPHQGFDELLIGVGLNPDDILASINKDVPSVLFLHTTENGGTVSLTITPEEVPCDHPQDGTTQS